MATTVQLVVGVFGLLEGTRPAETEWQPTSLASFLGLQRQLPSSAGLIPVESPTFISQNVQFDCRSCQL